MLLFSVQFLLWLFTNLGIISQCKSNIKNKRTKIAESKIEEFDASNNI